MRWDLVLVANGVAGGLAAPWRLYLARGCRYLSLGVGNRDEWDSWRAHLGCPDLSIRVYETEGMVRRSSVAEVMRGGCRIAVELVEDIDLADLRLLTPGGKPGHDFQDDTTEPDAAQEAG